MATQMHACMDTMMYFANEQDVNEITQAMDLNIPRVHKAKRAPTSIPLAMLLGGVFIGKRHEAMSLGGARKTSAMIHIRALC